MISPDEQHTIYTQGFEAGQEHSQPSRRTLELLAELERRVDDKLDAKVSFSTFTWALGIMMVVVLGVLGIIYAKVENIDTKASSTQNVVSNIQGLLEGAEITQ